MSYRGRPLEAYRLLFHDEGEPPLRQSWPPTAAGLKQAVTRDLAGLPLDALSYGINAACGAYHLSRVVEPMGAGVPLLKDTGTWTIVEGMRRLAAQGLDPTALVVEACHEIGLDAVLRVRLNDLHDIFHDQAYGRPDHSPKVPREPGWYYLSQHKREHPELLLGDPAPAPRHRAQVEAYAYNFALAPVRERLHAFVEETANTYDLDALLLDFMRWPYLFRYEEAYGQRHLFTAYLRRLRDTVRAAAAGRGRPIHLFARVPDTLELGARMGLDLRTWFAEALVDLVVIGAGYNSFDLPWDEISGEARRWGIPALATVRSSGEPPHYSGDSTALYYRKLRAAAMRAYARGVRGFELFNYFYHLPFYRGGVGGSGAGTGTAFVAELRDPERLRALPRTYELSRQSAVDYIYGHATFPAQLPCTVGRADDGLGPALSLDVPEQLPADADVELWLQLVDLGHEHRLEVSWNGAVLPFDVERDWTQRGSLNLGEVRFGLPAGWVRRGENRLGLRLLERPPQLDHFITLAYGLLHVDPAGQQEPR